MLSHVPTFSWRSLTHNMTGAHSLKMHATAGPCGYRHLLVGVAFGSVFRRWTNSDGALARPAGRSELFCFSLLVGRNPREPAALCQGARVTMASMVTSKAGHRQWPVPPGTEGGTGTGIFSAFWSLVIVH